MTLTVAPSPVPIRLDAGGTYRVGATRVTLHTVVSAFNGGSSAEQIVRLYPTLALRDVYGVINFYLSQKSEVDAYLAELEREAGRLRVEIESQPQNRLLREKLLARRTPQQ
ncbi:MAG: DUF433 domain-containing protein [Pirellulaceae bacterium]|nr:DUF433 domain-containing protein [Pirellulaceae bacterium]